MTKKAATRGSAARSDVARTTALLRDVAIEVAGAAEYFPALVRYLAERSGLSCTYVAELDHASTPRVHTLAVHVDGEPGENFEYDLSASPCARAVQRGLCVYPQDVRQLFPHDPDVQRLGAESCVGTVLFGADGAPFGLLVAMDRKPLEAAAVQELETVMQVLAAHASAEFERRRSQEQIVRLNRMLRATTDINQIVVRETDPARLFAETCRILVEHGGFRSAWIGLVRASGEYAPAAVHGAEPGSSDIEAARAVVEQVSVTVRDGRRAILPMRARTRVLGALCVTASAESSFVAAELDLLQGLADDVGFALQTIEEARTRERIERALRESQHNFETLVSNLPGMAYSFRLDGSWMIEFVSDGSIALTGRPPSDFINQSTHEFGGMIHPDDRQRVWDNIQAALAERRSFGAVYRIRTAGGEQKWVWEQGRGAFGAADGHLRFEGFVTDITERIRAEEELRASEERFRSLTELSSDWYWEQDEQYRFTRVSGAVRDVLGFGPSDFAGRRLRDFGAEPVGEDGWTAHKRLLDARAPFTDFTLKMLTARGEMHYLSANGQPMFDFSGDFKGYRGTAKDVTAVVRAEQLLRLEHSVTRLLADAADVDEVLRFVIDAVCRTEMWEFGQYWRVDEAGGVLRAVDLGGAPTVLASLGQRLLEQPLARGAGLPGAAWDAGQALWSEDLAHDARTHAHDLLRDSGMHGALLFPVTAEGETLGVLGFASRDVRTPDERLLRAARVIGSQIGLFMRRHHAQEVLRQSEERFRSLTELSSDWYWEQDSEYRFTVATGKHPLFTPETVLGRLRWELPYREVTPEQWRAHRAQLDARQPFEDFAVKWLDASGELRHGSISGIPIFDRHGGFAGYRGIGRDITERVRAEAGMRKLSSAIQQTADSVMITDRDGVIEYVNAAFETTTGFTRAEAVGRTPSLLRSGVQDVSFYEKLWGSILSGETFADVFINRKKNGELYYEEKTVTPLRDDAGAITHFISTGKDITERMRAQERLQYLAHHDALTGLPNRVLFLDRLNQMLNRAQRHGRLVGIMFLDIDRFKTINDTLGHDVGDLLLKSIAARLRTCVREGDTVARFGGDEFAVLLDDVAQSQDVSVVAEKIVNAFTQPFALEAHELFITPSIGISLFPTDGNTGATLLKNADAAMYRAKDAGKNNYQFYSAELTTAALERLTLETSLRHALAREEFVLHYQPQIELASGRLIGVEALLRWQHPSFGMLLPAHFIAIAEETGVVVGLGDWALRAALAQLVRWRSAGFGDLRMAVNVSGRQLSENGFVASIAGALAESGLPAEALELEITESVIMKNADTTIEQLQALHNLGVRFAVDDFGTGYSSLSYLRRFPIHTLKVDKSFIRDLTQDSGDAEIVKTIIAMARGLKLSVVAEGLETRDQLLFLQAQGCYAAQGYLIGRPLLGEQMTERLARRDTRPWLA